MPLSGNGGLGLTVEGPCEAKIECLDNGDGSCSVNYLPTEPGDYKINVLFADEHVPGSPFTGWLFARYFTTVITTELFNFINHIYLVLLRAELKICSYYF